MEERVCTHEEKRKARRRLRNRMRMNLQEERSIPSSSSRGLRGISDLFCGYWRRNVGFLKRSGGVGKWIFAEGVLCGSRQGSQEDEQIKEEEMKIMRGNRKGGKRKEGEGKSCSRRM